MRFLPLDLDKFTLLLTAMDGAAKETIGRGVGVCANYDTLTPITIYSPRKYHLMMVRIQLDIARGYSVRVTIIMSDVHGVWAARNSTWLAFLLCEAGTKVQGHRKKAQCTNKEPYHFFCCH
jgi:hypothetical protein